MSEPPSGSPGFRRASDVRYRVLDGEAVVLRQRAAEVLGLNRVGSRVLELVDGESGVPEILDRLADEFEVERGTLEADVRAFLDELVAAGVLERVPAETAP
jgi:pyrroloquinoline quinone biosynthesis protein D